MGVNQTRDQTGERGLTGTDTPDNGERAPGRNTEIDVLENNPAVVGERHIAKFQPAFQRIALTFVANIAGQTRTIPTAIYTYLNQPGGDDAALRLVWISVGVSLAALMASEWASRRAKGG